MNSSDRERRPLYHQAVLTLVAWLKDSEDGKISVRATPAASSPWLDTWTMRSTGKLGALMTTRLEIEKTWTVDGVSALAR